MMRKRMRKALLPVVIVFIFVFVFTGFSFNSPASEALNRNTVKYYTSVQVSMGDSLWSIAEEYITPEYRDMDTYIDEIKSINGLRSDQIQQGVYLNIPYYVTADQ